MDLIYPINLVGHDEWLDSAYSVDLAAGDVITRDGEVIGQWQVVNYDPDDDFSGGRYEFLPDGQCGAAVSEEFGLLDSRTSRGLALLNVTRAIRHWHEAQDA